MKADLLSSRVCQRLASESGVALLHVVLLMTLVTAVAAGAATLARTEVLVSRYHHDERGAAYAAQAMLAAALQELDRGPQWNDVLTGARIAAFADGSLTAPRQIPGGGTVLICCGPGTPTGRLRTETGLAWQPFAWQSLSRLLNLGEAPRYYLIAWVVDDPADGDGDPLADSNDRILVRAEAVTPLGVRKAVEATMERAPPDPVSGEYAPGLRFLTWREPD